MSESTRTIYAELLDARLDEPRRELRRSVERFVRNGGLEALVSHYEGALKSAYMAGHADGFAQGVERAESRQRIATRCSCGPGDRCSAEPCLNDVASWHGREGAA